MQVYALVPTPSVQITAVYDAAVVCLQWYAASAVSISHKWKKCPEATQTLRAGCSKADPQTNKQTHRQGRLQYTAQLGAQCNNHQFKACLSYGSQWSNRCREVICYVTNRLINSLYCYQLWWIKIFNRSCYHFPPRVSFCIWQQRKTNQIAITFFLTDDKPANDRWADNLERPARNSRIGMPRLSLTAAAQRIDSARPSEIGIRRLLLTHALARPQASAAQLTNLRFRRSLAARWFRRSDRIRCHGDIGGHRDHSSRPLQVPGKCGPTTNDFLIYRIVHRVMKAGTPACGIWQSADGTQHRRRHRQHHKD